MKQLPNNIRTTITVVDLARFGACEEGIGLFLETFGESVVLTVENLQIAIDVEMDIEWLAEYWPDLPSAIVKRLSRDKSWRVRQVVALRPDLPSEIVEQLSRDADWRVLREIALRPDLPAEIIERLSMDADWDVRRTIAHR
jgi:hypothetical protein